jgi:hypothetical protein
MPTLDQIIDEPQTLFGLFPDSDDDDGDETTDGPLADDDPNGQHKRLLMSDCDNAIASGYHYEIQSLVVANETLRIRQFAYHSHNANRVWPGTFNLANYLLETVPLAAVAVTADTTSFESVDDVSSTTTTTSTSRTNYQYKHYWGRVLELGTATGILAIRLAMASSASSSLNNQTATTSLAAVPLVDSSEPAVGYSHCCTCVVTSDVVDDYQDIATNLAYNCALNQLSVPPVHVPHTWGTGWVTSCREACACTSAAFAVSASATDTDPSSKMLATCSSGYEALFDSNDTCMGFDTIVASDILLYVAAYPALVTTLVELVSRPLRPESSLPCRVPGGHEETSTFATPRRPMIVLSWNRRMKESQEFFERMERAGFTCTHQGQCIYTFVFRD